MDACSRIRAAGTGAGSGNYSIISRQAKNLVLAYPLAANGSVVVAGYTLSNLTTNLCRILVDGSVDSTVIRFTVPDIPITQATK